jgi:hypothetical protein
MKIDTLSTITARLIVHRKCISIEYEEDTIWINVNRSND